MFEPIQQDPKQVSFCHLLKKQDRLIDPSKQNALTIFNHWRAFVVFPKTAFNSWYFNQEVKINQCALVFKHENLDLNDTNLIFDLLADIDSFKEKINSNQCQKIFESTEWLQVKCQKRLKTYLLCAEKTLLEISEITLQNGKKLDLKGFLFTQK